MSKEKSGLEERPEKAKPLERKDTKFNRR